MSLEGQKQRETGSKPGNSDYKTGDVASGLKRIRAKLLDLTGRNKLLNFRHTKASTLRIVDELPNQLFSELLNEKIFSFDPVPLPKPEQMEAFWLAKKEKDPDLEIDPKELPPVEEFAVFLGIDTKYEVPLHTDGEGEKKHQDLKIQTLHYPERLEAILKRISSLARGAIEETGSNMLYLTFGFLEWYDDENSNKKNWAPLIHVPVVLEKSKRSKGGYFKFELSYSGEDITANLSLREKLKQDFGIALPELSEDEEPENYFAKVEKCIKNKPRWKIRRCITLSLLHFGKLLLFLDLDPERWPWTNSILKHPLVKQFFTGEGEYGESAPYAEEYNLDTLPDKEKKSPIIYDADSSQHSALIDAMEGRSLVIEGPPGTGKSQTITNLIALALHQKKSVLFVAEKLAALEVVRRRLNSASLGDFCLELHSHKTQKRKLLEDVALRLKKKGSYREPPEIEKKIGKLENYKEKLKAYVWFIRSQCGETGLTYHQILMAAARYNQETKKWQAELDRIFETLPWTKTNVDEFNGVQDFNCDLLDELEDQSETFLTARAGVLQDLKKITDHPWTFVNVFGSGYQIENQIIETIKTLQKQSERLIKEFERLKEDLKYNRRQTLKNFEGITKIAGEFTDFPGGPFVEKIPFLRDYKNLEAIKSWHNQVANFDEKLADFSAVFSTKKEDLPDALATLRKHLLPLREVLKGSVPFSDIPKLKQELDNLPSLVDRCEPLFFKFSERLGEHLEFNLENARIFLAVIKSFAEAPIVALKDRRKKFERPEFSDILTEAFETKTKLVSDREKLEKSFHISLCPSLKELEEAAAVVETANFFSIFSKEWRAARALHKKLRKTGRVPRNKVIAEDFYSLASLLKEERAFADDEKFKTYFGTIWAGIETRLENVQSLQDWHQSLQQTLAESPLEDLVSKIFNADENVIVELGELEGSKLFNETGRLISASTLANEQINESRLDFSKPFQKLKPHLKTVQKLLGEALDKAAPIIRQKDAALEVLLATFDAGVELETNAESAAKNTLAKKVLGKEFGGVNTETKILKSLLETFSFVEKILENEGIEDDLKEIFLGNAKKNFWVSAKEFSEKIRNLSSEFQTVKKEAENVCALNDGFWNDGKGEKELGTIVTILKKALQNKGLLTVWLKYQRTKEKLEKNGLGPLISLVEDGHLPEDRFIASLRYFFFQDLGMVLREHVLELKEFNSFEHVDTKKKFIQLDKEILELNRQVIAARADTFHVPHGISSRKVKQMTELSLLKWELGKTRRHIPIRQLVRRSGRALKALKPCFMMGPLSVAQYLEPGEQEFDLVIMDEASQMKPENALGAIARAKQVVVVGDSKQLPPTDFFNRVGGDDGDEDEEYGVTEDTESILELAGSIFKPRRLLNWHYRSKHESLIAFSNQKYYSNSLKVFPSSLTKGERLGVSLRFVEKATYKASKNQVEAQTIARHAIRFMEEGRKESLGIVAMNVPQANLIEEEVDRLTKASPRAQEYRSLREGGKEPFFVKNLENVQGDERDVIFISFTYGPDPETGKVYQRFHPITKQMGWRRLNVLFTRARRQVVAFSSMKSGDIVPGPNSSRGIGDIKAYLEYADTGTLETPVETEREPDSDFEVAVLNELGNRGYECVPQVGSAGFFIDIGVKHPDKEDSFIVGVECDGASYHSGVTVRDRDRLRQEILENLGWRIIRVWSTDWFDNSEFEIERICSLIEGIRKRDQQKAGRQKDLKPGKPEQEADRKRFKTDLEEMGFEEEVRTPKPTKTNFGISVEEARERLIEMRENNLVVDFPEVDPAKSLLRNEMIDALLKHLPYDEEEFLEVIPGYLRSNVGPGQFKAYFPKVLEIIEQVQEN